MEKPKLSDEKFMYHCPDFTFNEKRVNCMRCGHEIVYPERADEFDVSCKYQEHIDDIYNGYEEMINELADFFPDTPIKEFLNMKRDDLKEVFQLLAKRLNGKLTDTEEIILEQNHWIKEMKKNKNK